MRPSTQFLSLFFISCICASCVTYKPYTTFDFTVPLQRGGSVEVFYPGDIQPHKEYVVLGELGVSRGFSPSKQTLLNLLTDEARKAGVDGLLNVYTDHDFEGTHFMYGTGIKYIQNLSYLDNFIHEESFYKLDTVSNEKELIAQIERNPDGSIVHSKFSDDEAKSVYQNYVQPYRDFHLLNERRNWAYLTHVETGGLSKRRYTRLGNEVDKICKFKYDNGRLTKIIISYPKEMTMDHIQLFYDDKDAISNRKIAINSLKMIMEEYGQDERGRLITKSYRMRQSLHGAFYHYISEYTYYKKEDIHDFIN